MSRNPSSLSVPLLVIPPATLTLLISPVVSALTFNSDAEILPSSPSFSSSFPSLSIICAVFCTSILLMATPMPTPALAPLAENVTIAFVTLVSLLASILIMPVLPALSLFAVNLASVSTITLL